jgi:hypothetical protein
MFEKEEKMTEATMDLAQLDTRKGAEQGFELQLTHPQTGLPLAGRITLLGQDASAWQEKQAELIQRRVNRLQRNKKNTASVGDLENDSIELLVAVTVGWSGIAFEGQPFAWSPENAKKLYTDFAWIREQAYEAVNDRGNFLPRSASN